MNDINETNYIYEQGEMLCRIDLYVIDVICTCKMKVVGDVMIKDSIEYSDIKLLCLNQAFTHPCEWNPDGDFRSSNDEDFMNEWNHHKQILIERIHSGFYNYELGYKIFNL